MELPEVCGVTDGVMEVVRELGERETDGHVANDVFEDSHLSCRDWSVAVSTDEQLAVEDGLRGRRGSEEEDGREEGGEREGVRKKKTGGTRGRVRGSEEETGGKRGEGVSEKETAERGKKGSML